jgi:hypothetical protein
MISATEKRQQDQHRRENRHQPDDDLPNIPELSPMDSAQARRAWRLTAAGTQN